jgi:hypothetical protein
MLEQFDHGRAIARKHADADADRGDQRAAIDHHGRGEHFVDTRRRHGNLVGGVHAIQHHDELVAAHANDNIRGTHRRAHAPGDLLEQLVADFVTTRIVDVLEAVEIEEQYREHLP